MISSCDAAVSSSKQLKSFKYTVKVTFSPHRMDWINLAPASQRRCKVRHGWTLYGFMRLTWLAAGLLGVLTPSADRFQTVECELNSADQSEAETTADWTTGRCRDREGVVFSDLLFYCQNVHPSLPSGVFPQTQTTKKEQFEPSQMNNCRPISNLLFLGKVREKAAFQQLNHLPVRLPSTPQHWDHSY